MKLLSLLSTASVVAAFTLPPELDITDSKSIKLVAGTLAFDAMSYYKGNYSDYPKDLGDLQDPYYWWVAGALWGAMLDYYHYTGDATYNDVVIDALLGPTNLGKNNDYMPPEHADEEGNDDLFFWGSAVLSAAERNFPQPNKDLPSWLQISENVFNELVGRWNTTHCNGGLLWQIYPSNPNGMNYKNSVSNGGFFQLAARLARATGNDTYLDWAEKVWDWSYDVGFIDESTYHVYDGADSRDNCQEVNKFSFTYTSGIYLYGAAVMANYTKKDEWKTRTEMLFEGAGWFFSPFDNSTNVMYEAACEKVNRCNYDMSTFKGYLARFMYLTTQLVPSLREKITSYLHPSAQAAAKSCSGGKTGTKCGMRWYTGGYDGNPGLGQEMCALEVIQGLLVDDAPVPLQGKDIEVIREREWNASDKVKIKSTPTTTSKPASTGAATEAAKASETDKDDAANLTQGSLVYVSLSVSAVLLFLGLA
ncbi:glycosyl hydrolase family 76-domain-containing protein [Thelonectria olida]|uniref:Mannan endo-1,6-alpha-mannosidase n=1 Tax=Thelonectria olida TaxID=1576542 RepID=A0A9P8WB89_9HYPO|nr:glycosyl hydrolase family 76-domain-containing protein [Thelonectria olida]